MSQNMSITVLTVLIVAVGLFFMYGRPFSTQQFDVAAYQELCSKYRTAKPGIYKKEQMRMLVSEIDYLIKDDVQDITDPARKQLKQCARNLSAMMNE